MSIRRDSSSSNPPCSKGSSPQPQPQLQLQKPRVSRDLSSILLLLLLYILQGVPLGLSSTVPFLLQSFGVPYTDQAKFSVAHWPFGIKLLYAPIIDAIYWKRFGRRKSWLIPIQYLISLFLIVLAFTVEDLFESRNVAVITAVFFMLNLLAASQDVAVDGWALTMLHPENVGYASSCNAVGQMLGIACGYSVFLGLSSPNFANKFRSQPGTTGLVTLPQFMIFWAIVFAATTTLILIFKKEKKENEKVAEQHMNILGNYKCLWKIIKLSSFRRYCIFLLTVGIGTGAMNSLTSLKLVDQGVPKETIAFFVIPLIPFKLIIPVIAAKWIVGPRTLTLLMVSVPFRLLFTLLFPIAIYLLPEFKGGDGTYPFEVFTCLFIMTAIDLIPIYIQSLTKVSFANQVSDPSIGGTYMTLLNTISNIGMMWPTTGALWLVDYLTINHKTSSSDCSPSNSNFSGNLTLIGNLSESAGHSGNSTDLLTLGNNTFPGQKSSPKVPFIISDCLVNIDGYYLESVICVLLGIVWLLWARPIVARLHKTPKDKWKVCGVK